MSNPNQALIDNINSIKNILNQNVIALSAQIVSLDSNSQRLTALVNENEASKVQKQNTINTYNDQMNKLSATLSLL